MHDTRFDIDINVRIYERWTREQYIEVFNFRFNGLDQFWVNRKSFN